MRLPILILAAGASRRMGGEDKLLKQIDGEPLLHRTLRRATAVPGAQVFVTLPPQPHPRHAAIAGLPVEVIDVPDAAEGMAASLRRGLPIASVSSDKLMILLADLPDLTTDDLTTVAQASTSDHRVWRGATEAGKPGHPLIIHKDFFPAFQSLTGDTGGRDILKAATDQTRLIPLPGTRALTDLDTPEAWAEWEANRAADQ